MPLNMASVTPAMNRSAAFEDKKDEDVMNSDALRKIIRNEPNLYYSTPEFNSCLYLHFKSLRHIPQIHEFKGLKSLHLGNNAIKEIKNLDECKKLTCLYLQDNCIDNTSGLDMLENLDTLNLSSNFIRKIASLEMNKKITTLLISGNFLSDYESLKCLISLQNLNVLDVSQNQIADPELINSVFKQLQSLKVLYLKGNPIVSKTKNYRKYVVAEVVSLNYLDTSPVTSDERRVAQAFALGGIEAERKVKSRIQHEKALEKERIRRGFKNLSDRMANIMSENVEESRNENISTYITTLPLCTSTDITDGSSDSGTSRWDLSQNNAETTTCYSDTSNTVCQTSLLERINRFQIEQTSEAENSTRNLDCNNSEKSGIDELPGAAHDRIK